MAEASRSPNVVWHESEIPRLARWAAAGAHGATVWLTGLSGSGKSTIASALAVRLAARGVLGYTLDGDNLRHGLNGDLGFTEADRVENIRRVGEAAKLFVEAGLITIVSFISPFRSERRMARELLKPGQFIEIFIDTPISTCMARDPKGLYRRAVAGEIKNFTGVDSPYEVPENPELTLATEVLSAEDSAERVVAYLKEHRFVP